LDRNLGLVVFGIIDDRKIMDHRDQIGGIHGAFATGGATYLTVFQNPITCFQTFAGHPKSMAYGMNRKKIFGTNLHTIPTGSAFCLIHNRNPKAFILMASKSQTTSQSPCPKQPQEQPLEPPEINGAPRQLLIPS
jgi:hypothetical protein